MNETNTNTNAAAATQAALTQDWETGKNAPTYEQNGTWENWMSFGGVSCSEAFDAGYDGLPLGKFAGHPALIAAHESGGRQRIEEDNE